MSKGQAVLRQQVATQGFQLAAGVTKQQPFAAMQVLFQQLLQFSHTLKNELSSLLRL